MRKKILVLVLFSAAIAAAAVHQARRVIATPAVGFVGTTIAKGTIGEIDVFNHYVPPNLTRGEHEDHEDGIWLSAQRTKGASDLYVQNNVWQAGGSTGWHTHPGHSLIIVTAGTITAYEGDDPSCKPSVYTKGQAFVDHGGGHLHIIRNEGSEMASTVAVQLVPAGDLDRRIEALDPGNCHF